MSALKNISAKRLLLLAIILAFSSGTARAMCEGGEPIAKEQIEDMFSNIAVNTDWNMSNDMLWGYFFTDRNKSDLANAADMLERVGYELVSIRRVNDWQLHMERKETHTAESLFRRNKELYEFAAANNLDCYDGMDVGPID